MRAKLYQGMTRECLFNRLCHKMPRSGTIDERRDKYPTKFPKHDFTIKVPSLFSNFLNFVGPNLKGPELSGAEFSASLYNSKKFDFSALFKEPNL